MTKIVIETQKSYFLFCCLFNMVVLMFIVCSKENERYVFTSQFAQGDTLTNSTGMELVFIPAGEFMMGSRETPQQVIATEGGLLDWYQREHPMHRVQITNGFLMGVTEVTQRQYETVMGNNPSAYKGGDLPVEGVTWNDAIKFCKKLSTMEKRNYRLPTEAEWEYACRAGTDTRFHFGSDYSTAHQFMNYCDSSNTCGYFWQDKTHSDGFDRTSPVKSFPPNAFGLYDMHGNVWEYCSDRYLEYYYHESHIIDPKGALTGASRILRGGSWHDGKAYCRAAFRNVNAPDYTCDDNGMRVVLEVN
ncbi:formylglycine-generating enzyme family protein [candidate division KSB1 bacterium]|nr:formylglycine-generating enzyme family protein [candidate division KSB1 bacterium]